MFLGQSNVKRVDWPVRVVRDLRENSQTTSVTSLPPLLLCPLLQVGAVERAGKFRSICIKSDLVVCV